MDHDRQLRRQAHRRDLPRRDGAWLASGSARHGTARRKLKIIDAAPSIETLRVPPGNRLEPLKGGRKGQWSIRINDQWRICFRWKDGTALDVEIVDYH